MKKTKFQLLSGLLALTMLSGCASQQAQPEPTTVNQAMLIEKSGEEQADYTFPARFTGDWTAQEGKLTIHADAEVVAEQGTVLPTATVTPREFTQEDVDNLLGVFLKGEPLYAHVSTKEDYRKSLEYVQSSQWHADPDAPEQTPEQLEARRQELIAYYKAEIEKAPVEKPIVHGFSDSDDPERLSGSGTVDGVEYEVWFDNGDWRDAQIIREDYKYRDYDVPLPDVSKEDAIAQGEALMAELGFDNMVLDDVQQGFKERPGVWRLYYAPTVNDAVLSSIRQDITEFDGDTPYQFYQYWDYGCSEETNPDTVSWWMENVQIAVGKDGILSFTWTAPATEPVVKETQSALLPFEEIASIADTMLPIVIVGPKETPLVDLDRINGFDTHMDVEITKVSLTLMRVRDKGSLQGTIVPVWDFWGTWDWYDADKAEDQHGNFTTQPMLTINAVDGSVVDRQLGY